MKIDKLKLTKILLGLGILVSLTEIFLRDKIVEEKKTLRVTLLAPWRVLTPYLQHTLTGDLLLSNQYEPLVAMGPGGEILPLAAKSWTISEDRRTYRFTIDTEKQYPDGSFLSPHDFKNTWETSLRAQSISMNKSTQDVLYLIEGAQSFSDDHDLSGVRVIGSDQLEVEFRKPFRMALYDLIGVRYAAVKVVEGKMLGTGAFSIQELGPDKVLLTPNPFHKTKYSGLIEVSVQDLDAALINVKNNLLDVIHYASPTKPMDHKLLNESDIKILLGPEASHLAVNFNHTHSQLFKSKEMRKAFQTLLFDLARKSPELFGDPKFTRITPQFYLPFQAGHIPDAEAESFIEEGRSFIPQFYELNKKHPLRYIQSPARVIEPILKSLNLRLDPQSTTLSLSDFFKAIYNPGDFDLNVTSFSVVKGDPDSLYHRFGPNGALRTPYDGSKEVGRLLEEGRNLTDSATLPDHYQQVSRRLLDDVPIVHLGVNHSITIMSQDRVETQLLNLKRNNGHLFVYKLK